MGGEQRSERMADVHMETVDAGDVATVRSGDGRAHLDFVRNGTDVPPEVNRFWTQRSSDGERSAHAVMDEAQASGVAAPAELHRSFAPHPEVIDLMSDEPASVRFWQEHADAERLRDSGGPGADHDEAQAIARQMAENAEGRAEVPQFEPPEGWITDINAPGSDWPGRDHNCVFSGLATEMRWRGALAQAGEWPHDDGLSYETADELVGPFKETTPDEIERSLLDAGPGASGIVGISREFDEGHVVNVVNDRGQVRWLDGQAGTIDAGPPPEATSYFWSARDQEGRPL